MNAIVLTGVPARDMTVLRHVRAALFCRRHAREKHGRR